MFIPTHLHFRNYSKKLKKNKNKKRRSLMYYSEIIRDALRDELVTRIKRFYT